jgi:hypothetical protein
MTLSKSFIDLEKCLRTLRFLPSQVMMFAEFMEVVDFRAADYVFRIGDPANALYRILNGKAELLDQDQMRIQLLEPPFGIGFGFIIRKTVRSYDLRCIFSRFLHKIQAYSLVRQEMFEMMNSAGNMNRLWLTLTAVVLCAGCAGGHAGRVNQHWDDGGRKTQ